MGDKHFAYDGLNRLVGFDDKSGAIESYSYDRWGNLTQLTRHGAGGFDIEFIETDVMGNPVVIGDNTPDQIRVDSQPESTYNLSWTRGNLNGMPSIPLLGMNGKLFGFSSDDRLKESVSMADGTVWRYAYDTNGERVISWRKTPAGDIAEAKLAIRDEGGAVLTDWLWIAGETFTRNKDYFLSGGRMVAQRDWSSGSPVREYFFTDHLGSTRMAVRENTPGDFTAEPVEYFPFGGFRVEPATSTVNHLFTGHERDLGDTSSELDYMHARYYSPNLGRFVSVDPIGGSIGSSQSWNRYSYVLNNPINMVDPTGKIALVDDAVIGGVLLGAATIVYLNTPSIGDPTRTNAQVIADSIIDVVKPEPMVTPAGPVVVEPLEGFDFDPTAAGDPSQIVDGPLVDPPSFEDTTHVTPVGTQSAGDHIIEARKPDVGFVDSVVRDVGLNKEQRRMLHDEITGQNYSKEEIRETAKMIKESFPKQGKTGASE